MLNKVLGVLALAFAFVSAPAMAAGSGPDYTALTGAVDFDTTITAILAVGALAVTLTLAVVGVRKILRMIRSA